MKPLGAIFVVAVVVASACGQAEPQPASESSPESQAAPDVARIECEVNGAQVLTPVVRPQRDGVHLIVRNDSGMELGFSALDADGGGRGSSAPAGSATYIWPLAPGTLFVKCTDDQVDPSEVPGAELAVEDDSGIWISTRLHPGCRTASTLSSDYVAGAEGERGSAVEVARKAFEKQGLKAGDVVERAGYPTSDETVVRVTRGGEVIATMSLLDDGAGGWLPSETTACTDPPAFD